MGGGGGHVKIKKLYFYAPNILIFKNIYYFMVISRLHYDRIHEISDMIIMPGSFFTMSPDNLSLSAEDMLQSIIMSIA